MIVILSPLISNGTGNLGSASLHVDERSDPTGLTLDPALNLGPRRRSRKRRPPLAGIMDPRRNYQKASWIWSGMSEAERLPWRKAIKRGGISAYDVWMHDVLINFALGLNAPDIPSPSSGCYRVCRGRRRLRPPRPKTPGKTWSPPPQLDGWWDFRTDPDYAPECDPTPGRSCGFCTWECEPYSPAQDHMVIDADRFTGTWSIYNGSHILKNNVVDGCFWQGFDPIIQLWKINPDEWWLELWHPEFPIYNYYLLITEHWCCWSGAQPSPTHYCDAVDPEEASCEDYPGWQNGRACLRSCNAPPCLPT